MTAPKPTIWELEPHTRAKHAILKRYLQAWAPILSLGGFSEVLYIDGFAGPGRYAGGEDGSPIIALKAVAEQRVRLIARMRFLFVEANPDRALCLEPDRTPATRRCRAPAPLTSRWRRRIHARHVPKEAP